MNLVWTSIAVFSLFFGAGNVVYPLIIGRDFVDTAWVAYLGFFVSSILFPFLGLVGIALYQGCLKDFLDEVGNKSSWLIMLLLVLLLGPFAVMPRCCIVANASFSNLFPALDFLTFRLIFVFSGIVCLYRQDRLLFLLGRFLSPILLISLLSIILMGLLKDSVVLEGGGQDPFKTGLVIGYGTLDLLAALFFAPSIWILVASDRLGKTKQTMILSSIISLLLLAGVYFGLSLVASKHSGVLQGVNSEALLATLSRFVLGPSLSFVSDIAVILACFTTTLGLSATLTLWIKNHFVVSLSEFSINSINLVITGLISLAGFSGIMGVVTPIIMMIYPGVIVLTVCNILYKWKGVGLPRKTLFYITIMISLIFKVMV